MVTHHGVKKKSRNKNMKWRGLMKNRKLDVDQILKSLDPESLKKLSNRESDPDLPGEGKFYCIVCDSYYISKDALISHMAGKPHKMQLKKLKEGFVSPQEAAEAAGMAPPI
eukprot:gnl/Chilomastix_caulleri/475.p1 GENE.gnl/Chilomastix_caulleri/475~~gnl/Chilomastix_caulleri/475.p1  ORF type:complete len:125 (+),score=30.74 gnl/Chilomastix_caulleri/475:45-377(+)